jgi:GTP cyclohydrolase I
MTTMKRKRDLQLARDGINQFLQGLRYDPAADEQLEQTAERVVEAWTRDLLAGDGVDLASLLQQGSAEVSSGKSLPLVVLRDLDTVTMCPHHLLPALGRATVVYLPGTRVAGLGTIARLVDACSRRLVLQEQIGQQIVDALVQDLGAKGALCRLSFAHTCLLARGERQSRAQVDTLSFSGSFAVPGAEREMALAEAYAR